MIREVIDSYRQALRLLTPFLATHVFFRLVSAALLTPLFGLLITLSLWFSDQSALTDQDIAMFLLTPAGAIGALVLASTMVAAMVLDVAVMTATIRSGRTRPFNALRAGIRFAVRHAPALVHAGAGLVARIVLIALPFLAVGGGLFLWQLTEYDINYYLTYHPPEFLVTVGAIAVVLLALALVLLERLSGWALVLHLALFEHRSSMEAFRISRRRMKGHRRRLLIRVAMWLGVRLGIGAGISSLTAAALALAPDLVAGDLARAAVVILVVLALSLAATTVLNAGANGALADLLNDQFDRTATRSAVSVEDGAPLPPRVSRIVLAALALVSVASFGMLGGAAALTQRITSDAEVQVIGHRGAAALRPENTMASVLKAIEDGADWVEIDVQESAEGEIIVAHDSDFMKAAGNPIKVWDTTAEDLAGIDIGSWFDPAYADQRVPLLRDVLLAAKDKSKVIIELKYYGHDEDLENRVIAIVEELGMGDQIATMSLKYPAVQKMLSLRPDWRTGVLAATAVGDLTGLEGDFLAVSLTTASANLVQRANAAGKDVYVWTVNDPLTMSRMITLGADGLITDDPALARKVIEEHKTLPTVSRFALWLSDSFDVTFDRLVGERIEP